MLRIVVLSVSVLEAMVNRRRGRSGRNGTQSVAAVRIVPGGEGSREQKVERILAAIKESQSTTRVQLKDSFFASPAAGPIINKYSYTNIASTDDYSSLAQQFTKFRVVCFKFDVYDFNPGLPSLGIFGTYHGAANPGSLGEITDVADSSVVPPGTGMRSYYWYPSGPLEHSWFDVATPNDFGGLVYYLYGGNPGSKYEVIVSAVVDFRARI